MQDSLLEEEDRDQDSTDAAVAVHERVKDLELRVNDRELYERVGLFRRVVRLPPLEVIHETDR
jgi:hypothetical protein